MPIIHVHSPSNSVILTKRHIADRGTLIEALRGKGAQANICEPGFLGDITPPSIMKMLPPRTSVWLSVADNADVASVTYAIDRREVQPISTMFKFHEGEGGGVDVTVTPNPSGHMIGQDFAKNFAVSVETGHGFATREMVGSLVVHRTVEETAALMEIFQQPPPVS